MLEAKIKKMTVPALRKELANAGLNTKVVQGLKAELVDRLLEHKRQESSGSNKRKALEDEGSAPKRPKYDLKQDSSDGEDEPLDMEVSSKVIEFNRIRCGPQEVTMTETSHNITLSRSNLEVTSSSGYSFYRQVEHAKGNVKVFGGKWYFEVRMVTMGHIYIGWCSPQHNPQDLSHPGTFWAVDGHRKQKIAGSDSQSYGDFINSGDVLGCALDVESKTLQFWLNGKDWGVAFTNVVPDAMGLVPFVSIKGRGAVHFNFGNQKFKFPVEGYNSLSCAMTEKDLARLSGVFRKYRDLSNESVVEEEEEEGGGGGQSSEEMEREKIKGTGLLEFQKDLGVTDEEDPLMLIIAWKLNAKGTWELSKDEFMNGFYFANCATMQQIKKKIDNWRNQLQKSDLQFKKFYTFVFDYLREERTILLIDEAITLWNIVLKDRKWHMYDDWITFLTDTDKKSISRDVWQQLWHFMATYPKDLTEYDPSGSWPIIYDDFVEWRKEKGKGLSIIGKQES